MVMTEINFTESGFWASQWWYNIPPIGGPPNEFDFTWDATGAALEYGCFWSSFWARQYIYPWNGL